MECRARGQGKREVRSEKEKSSTVKLVITLNKTMFLAKLHQARYKGHVLVVTIDFRQIYFNCYPFFTFHDAVVLPQAASTLSDI